MMNVLKCAFLVLGFVFALPSFGKVAAANEALTLHLNYLPYRLTGDSLVQYDKLLAEVLYDFPGVPNIEMAPLRRSATNFKNDPNGCLFPTNPTALKAIVNAPNLDLLVSIPTDIVSLRLYTRPGSSDNMKLADIIPKRLGYIRGSGAVKLLGKNTQNYQGIASEEQLIRMLALDRIDAFVGHHPDTAIALDVLGSGLRMQAHVLQQKSPRLPISFVCHNTKQGAQFIQKMSKRIGELHQINRMRLILGPHADLPDQKLIEKSGSGS